MTKSTIVTTLVLPWMQLGMMVAMVTTRVTMKLQGEVHQGDCYRKIMRRITRQEGGVSRPHLMGTKLDGGLQHHDLFDNMLPGHLPGDIQLELGE